MHYWHDLHPGEKAPEIVNALIEIPMGSKGKYELDKTTGVLKLDRVLFSSVHYPTNYGFIPQTLCGDHDPLDILVFSSIAVPSLCIMKARVIGVMRMVDQGEADDKIIAVSENDINVNYITSLDTLPPHTLVEIRRFFEDYKILEGKKIDIEGFLDKQQAMRVIQESFDLYKTTFHK